MAQAVNGNVSVGLNLAVTQDIGLADQAEARAKRSYSYDFADGSGAGKAHQLWTSEARSIAASGNETLDLNGGLTDAFGNSITLTKIKGILIKASANNANDVLVGGAGSNTFVGLFGDATDVVKVKPGGLLLAVAPDANGLPVVAGTGDQLKVANSGAGSAVVYDIAIWGE